MKRRTLLKAINVYRIIYAGSIEVNRVITVILGNFLGDELKQSENAENVLRFIFFRIFSY